MKILGIMTGTSLDAVDIALVEFSGDANNPDISIIEFDEIPINYSLRNKIIEISQKPVLIQEISSLNFAISEIYFQAVNSFLQKYAINSDELNAIGIHGQTVWHQPLPHQIANISIASTLQLGNASYLAKKTGVKVISDFRSGDIALGGQGAPLIPIFDKHFLYKGNNVIILNIGGIANITYLPEINSNKQILAFDTGPGNMLIDIMTAKLYGKDYDKDGAIASEGDFLPELYSKLMETEYLHRSPPKSTGRELFNYNFLDRILDDSYRSQDIIRTLTEFTASSIAMNINKQGIPQCDIVISGGGGKNNFLVGLLKSKLSEYTFKMSDDYGIPSAAKESICFAFLAYLNLMGLNGNIPSVTGASKATVLGSVSLP